MKPVKVDNNIKWDMNLMLGNEQVDSQHQQLFEMVNSLIHSCAEGSDLKKLKDTLDFLVNYTVQHFNDEEKLMIDSKYPEYEQHKQKHEEFKITVVELVQRFTTTGSSSELSNDVNKVIVKWLICHILTEDKKIGEHLTNCGM